MKWLLLLTGTLTGCASEQTIRGECTLQPACQCNDDCPEPDSETPGVVCPDDLIYDAQGTYHGDFDGSGCDVVVDLWGGGGGGGPAPGAGGSFARAEVTGFGTLTFQVGWPGLGGGAPDGAGGGGAASWVAEPGGQAYAVAGGGGGGASTAATRTNVGDETAAPQTGTDGADGSGAAGGAGGHGAVGLGGTGGDGGGGGGGGGAEPGTGGSIGQAGTGGGSWSRSGPTDLAEGQQPGNAGDAAGSAEGGAPNTDGTPGRVVIRFRPPER